MSNPKAWPFSLQTYVNKTCHQGNVLIKEQLINICFSVLFIQVAALTSRQKSQQSKVEEMGDILDKMRVKSKTTESNLGKCYKYNYIVFLLNPHSIINNRTLFSYLLLFHCAALRCIAGGTQKS